LSFLPPGTTLPHCHVNPKHSKSEKDDFEKMWETCFGQNIQNNSQQPNITDMALNSVFALVWLAETARLRKITA